jgi:hypothetical protein
MRNWIRNFLLVKEDPDRNPDPDPKLGQKWDRNPDPDPKKIVSDPQHWFQRKSAALYPPLNSA